MPARSVTATADRIRPCPARRQAAGIAAPRDSDMQASEVGDPLDPGASLGGLRRGDLVCWKGHVGIIAGAGTLLHANAHHMAVAREQLGEAITRIAATSGAQPSACRRLPRLGG